VLLEKNLNHPRKPVGDTIRRSLFYFILFKNDVASQDEEKNFLPKKQNKKGLFWEWFISFVWVAMV
jgi:hypothetical protein